MSSVSASLDLSHRFPNSPNAAQHAEAVVSPRGVEKALIDIINAEALFAQCYQRSIRDDLLA